MYYVGHNHVDMTTLNDSALVNSTVGTDVFDIFLYLNITVNRSLLVVSC